MITIVDYGQGNLGSIANMLKKVGAEAQISSDPAVVGAAEKLILPGVGAFESGMANLEARGLVAPLHRRVIEDRVPILGLCLGLQLFGTGSEEGTPRRGLGWIGAHSVRFRFAADRPAFKVPHMGWNQVVVEQPSPLFDGMPEDSRFYFVHSYHLVCDEPGIGLTTTTYGHPFTSGIVKGNILGLQFHPEKSHKFGMQLFRNFVAIPT